VPQGAANTEAAFPYLKFMMMTEAQAEFGKVSHIAVLKSAFAVLVRANLDPRQLKFYNMMDHLYFLPGGVMEAQLGNIIAKAMVDTLTGKVPARTALEEAQQSYQIARQKLLGY
jgi:ABC-type glycerol-3-phosphate transport system substrate-binding protein